MNKVKEELQRLEKNGVIQPVTEPSEWCAPMVPIVKKNGKVRITVDYKKLNVSVKRQQYMLPNLEDIAPKLAGAIVFSSLDAASGYYQIPLDPSSSMMTTFMTPFGRFRFERIPMGISAAPEVFQRKMSELLAGHEGCEVIMDDILVYGKDAEEHDARLNKVMKTIEMSGLKLNEAKCQIKKDKLTYFGHIVGAGGVQPNPEKVKAIMELQPPNNVSELRTMIGMLNYLGRFTPGLSSTVKPMTDLLKDKTVWHWGEPQQKALTDVKSKISQLPALAYYRPDRETVVSADASSFGLGGVILQRDGVHLMPVAFCSRTLTEAERKYAQIEKECLASVWACEKFAKYLIGLDKFELLTDHKPLVPLMTSKDLDQGPIRCQRLLIRLMRFNPVVRHVPGKTLVIADALSRNPIPCQVADEEKEEEITAYVNVIQAAWPATKSVLQNISNATARDPILQIVAAYTVDGWPSIEAIPGDVKQFYQMHGDLSVVDGFVTNGSRIVIPEELRRDVLEKLHEGHQGRAKCRERAQSAVWWPGIGKDINAMVEACQYCREFQPTQRHEPLRPTPLPNRPWEKLAADLCEIDKKVYLVTVDYYSRWIDIKFLTSTSSRSVIGKFKELFSNHGIPDALQTDNGPQFSSEEFSMFASEYGFVHTTSSPHYPQANGEAEWAVKTAKKILRQPNGDLALLSYRATPSSATGVSPAEALMGRRLRTRLPILPQNLIPCQPNRNAIQQADQAAKRVYKTQFDRRHGVRVLPMLEPGQHVFMKLKGEKAWKKPGQVLLADPQNRTYQVATPQGVVRRNRMHLQVAPPPPMEEPPPQVPPPLPPPLPLQLMPESSPPAAVTVRAPPTPESPMGTPAPPRRSGRQITLPVRYRNG
jgi:transposase InsO family protein